jgi:hypothetical protein
VPTSDPVGTALWSIGAGATTGATVMTVGVLVVRLLQVRDPALSVDVSAQVLTTSVFVGLVAAVATAGLRTRAVPDPWRRGVTAAVAVFGAALVAVVATAADTIAGWQGLAAYLVLLFAAAVFTHRQAARAAQR